MIESHIDVATMFNVCKFTNIDLEKAVSDQVSKRTTCGAWARFEDEMRLHGVHEKWLVDIRKTNRGFLAHSAQMVSPELGEWVPVSEWSADLTLEVAWEEGLDDGYFKDPQLVEFLGTLPWVSGRVPDLFEVEFVRVVRGPGVRFGSIIEGTERNAEQVCVPYPCEPEDVWKALGAVEMSARDVWMATHGCEYCWGMGLQPEEMWDTEHAVDPECPKCQGQGRVI